MRIAFLSPSAQLGGAERCLLDLVASLAATEDAPALCVFAGTEGPLVERLHAIAVDARVVPMPATLLRAGESALRFRGALTSRVGALLDAARAASGALRHVRDLRLALAEFRPDVVHTNGLKHHVLGAIAAPRGARVVWHVRDLLGERALTPRLLRLVARRTAGAIAISRLVADDLGHALPGVPASIVHDGIDVDEFSPGPAEPNRLDALAGFSPGPALRVGLVATYARWKGHDLFLEAARLTEERIARREVRFYIAGGPIYATAASQFTNAELRNLAVQLGVADRVRFVPFQADPAWLFRTLDIAVHASTRPEPFGRTIAEAMACGCAVAATRTAGATEILDDCPNATLVPAGDAKALARAVSLLAARSGPEARAQGRITAVRRYARARLGPQMVAAYRALGLERGRA